MAEPLRAAGISVGRCEHGSIFIHFHDADGEIFALASMDLACAIDVQEDFQAEIVTVAKAQGVDVPAEDADEEPSVH